MKIFSVLGLWLVAFNIAYASVRINEIAWMGTSVSGTDEWIELFNDGDTSVDLSGWDLAALDGSPNITLTGTIAPYGYFLIERTDDTTVPDIAADEIAPFGSGLSNLGETLVLKDQSGKAVDTVEGGSDWVNVGGDNTTKETAQYTGSGWVTGVPTPRAANVTHGEVSHPASSDTTSPSVQVTQTPTSGAGTAIDTSVTPTYPRGAISVIAGDDKSTFVYTPVVFSGTAYGLYDERLPYATYHWNFGDGATGEGISTTHAYQFIGDYTVTLEVVWGSLRKIDHLNVHVVPVGVVIGETFAGADGFIELSNHSAKEVDLSLWRLQLSDGSSFTIPENTFIAPSRSVRFSNKTTGLVGPTDGLELVYPSGVVVGNTATAPRDASVRLEAKSMSVPVSSAPRVVLSAFSATQAPHVVSSPANNAPAEEVLWRGNEDGAVASLGALGGSFSRDAKWIFLVFFVGLIILAGFIISRANTENSIANEYAILEDMIEGKDELARD